MTSSYPEGETAANKIRTNGSYFLLFHFFMPQNLIKEGELSENDKTEDCNEKEMNVD